MSIKPSLLIVYGRRRLRLAQAREVGLLTLGQGLPLCGVCPCVVKISVVGLRPAMI